MKRKSLYILLAITALLVTSCDEMFTEPLPDDVQFTPAKLVVSRDVLTIMVADSIPLRASIHPDSVLNNAFAWFSDDPAIASVSRNVLHGVSPGETFVRAQAVVGPAADTCQVVVFPFPHVNSYAYRYDMPIYADVTIGDERLNERMVVVARCGDEIRGVGSIKSSNDIQYLQLRVYSNEPSGEEINFLCYHRDSISFVPFDKRVTFNANHPIGTLSNLYQFTGDWSNSVAFY